MSVEFIGITFPNGMEYSIEENDCINIIKAQIERHFSNERNALINLTWFGPQFNTSGWPFVLDCESSGITYDNIFFLATVDPPYLNDTELREVKNKLKALRVFYLGNFDSPHGFNFFAPVISKKFKKYTEDELLLTDVTHIYVSYSRKPREHRVTFVKKLIENNLLNLGVATLGVDNTNDLLLSIGEKDQDYLEWGNSTCHWGKYGVPHDMYSLHRMDIWKTSFLYINSATEFNPINDLFCQQDTFKPMIGMRPFVINGVQKTYRWLRLNGFKTFNHYWEHIDIENGDVHNTIVELIKYLNSLSRQEILLMYNDMIPDLKYNKERFFEFSKEQNYKINNLFQ